MTKQGLRTLHQVLEAVTEAVAGAGPAGIPSGSLYAMLMAYGCTLSAYEGMISMLVELGRIKKAGDRLIATGVR